MITVDKAWKTNQAVFFCVRQVHKFLPINLGACKPSFIYFFFFIHHIWGERVLWGAFFIIQTSYKMQHFTIFQDKLHSFNTQDHRSKRGLLISETTGSPSSKYEHRRASALLRNIQNIRTCMAKKPIVSVTYENERISIKNSLPYIKCVLRLSCVVHGPIYGRFMGFYVNGFLSI